MSLEWQAKYGLLLAHGTNHHFAVIKDRGRWICLYQPTGAVGMMEVPGPYTISRREAQINAERFEQEHARIGSA